MSSEGQTFTTMSGARIRANSAHAAGGQGYTYWARHLDTGEIGILKMFRPEHVNPTTTKRVENLVSMRLDKKHPSFAAPSEAILQKGQIGHFSRHAKGLPLDQILYGQTLPFVQSITLALSIVGALDALRKMGCIHGDIHPGNILVHRDPGSTVLQITLIDFDNFRSAVAPLPLAAGHPLYLAPELRFALRKKQPAIPDEGSDNFALGILLHEAILLKHPSAGFDEDPDSFERTMTAGCWPHDPARPDTHSAPEGMPAQVLDCHLSSLLRRVFLFDASRRPSPHEWIKPLCEAANHISVCETCCAPCVADAAKRACPVCSTPFPILSLVIERSGRRIPLDNGCVRIGRPELDGSATVSSIHAVFRQFGPELTLQSYGLNGTFKKGGDGSWTRLSDGNSAQIERGDFLRFADVETHIE